MKIWQWVESYHPDYGGGAAVAAKSICESLNERGHEVRVLCTESNDTAPYSIRTETINGVRVDRISLPYFRRNDPDGWQLGRQRWKAHERQVDQLLRALIAEWRPDVVHTHMARPLGEQCFFTLAKLSVPIVATLHDAWLICPRMYLLRSPDATACSGPSTCGCLECLYSHYDGSRLRALAKLPWRVLKLGTYPAWRLARRRAARQLLSGTMPCAQWLGERHRGHVPGRMVHLPLGIDLSDRPAQWPDRPRTPLRFGFVGGFQPHKGLGDVLQAVEALSSQERVFELHVWGPGQDTAAAQAVARNPRIRLRGTYTGAGRWEAYAEMDVLLAATTVCDSFPLVMQEGAAAGVPIIAPAIGGFAEWVRSGENGLLYRFRDATDLRRQMQRILDEPDLLPRLQSRLTFPRDSQDAVDKIECFYRDVLVGPA